MISRPWFHRSRPHLNLLLVIKKKKKKTVYLNLMLVIVYIRHMDPEIMLFRSSSANLWELCSLYEFFRKILKFLLLINLIFKRFTVYRWKWCDWYHIKMVSEIFFFAEMVSEMLSATSSIFFGLQICSLVEPNWKLKSED